MAHFAEIDENNVVLRVIVVNDNDTSIDGLLDETIGAQFCHDLLGGDWVRTSYSGSIRQRFAGIGSIWRPDIDAFMPPQPFVSWTLDVETGEWNPPAPQPEDSATEQYEWDEDSLAWVANPVE